MTDKVLGATAFVVGFVVFGIPTYFLVRRYVGG